MLDAFADCVEWFWTKRFFIKNVGWKFKSVQISIQHFFFHIGWRSMRFRVHSTWINILERKISISINFERLNVRMRIRIYCSFGQLFLSFYKNDSQSGETTVEQTKETIKNGKKKWTVDEVQDLIELLEEKPCLWNSFSNEYTKKEVKESL